MASVNQALSIQQAETEIAVLKVQVNNIEEKVGEIKQDVKDLRNTIDDHAEETQNTLKEMKEASANAHKGMNEKISSLEKWRWMMMGAGIALGALGHNVLGGLLK
jgi:peptidoglycan hydrolase CwlO-like protein